MGHLRLPRASADRARGRHRRLPRDRPTGAAGKARAGLPETTQFSYGLGWAISDYRGHLLIAHGGGIDGFRATVQLAPRAKLGLVVLANLGGTAMPEAVAN